MKKRNQIIAIILPVFYFFLGTTVSAQTANQTGFLEIVNKSGTSSLSTGAACEMNVFTKKITFQPGVSYKILNWPNEWQFAGKIAPRGGRLTLYVNSNERMLVRVSKYDANASFWGFQVLQPGHALHYELFCPLQ